MTTEGHIAMTAQERIRGFYAALEKLKWNANEHDELVTLTPNQCRAVLGRLAEVDELEAENERVRGESQRWHNRATVLAKQCQTMRRDLRSIARISRGWTVENDPTHPEGP